jgi:hypothetical protein
MIARRFYVWVGDGGGVCRQKTRFQIEGLGVCDFVNSGLLSMLVTATHLFRCVAFATRSTQRLAERERRLEDTRQLQEER